MIHINFHSPADLPPNEDARQQAVDRCGIVNRPRDPALQRVAERAAALFKTPIAAITIVDHDRQWLAARVGIDAEETSRSVAFCAHAILQPGELMVVPDAREDPCFSGNPLVLGDPHIRFYAGVPLVDSQGYPLGALCIIDSQPREKPSDLAELTLLAREAERLIAR